MEYVAPNTLEDFTRVIAESGGLILAGGTDVMPRWSKGKLDRPGRLIDLKHVEGLRGISRACGEVRIGACTPMSDLARDPIILATAPVLARATDRVACPQVRNRATIGGNLCNASPAADAAVPLILLDAVLELASVGQDGVTTREVSITEFFRGPGSTVLEAGEILTGIRFDALLDDEGPPGLKPAAIPQVFAAWEKFGTRPAMEIAVASVGVALWFEDGRVNKARVGYGSVAPTPLRGRMAEGRLVGHTLTAEVIEETVAAAREEISPISDVRAGADYRREIVGVLLRRMLGNAKTPKRQNAKTWKSRKVEKSKNRNAKTPRRRKVEKPRGRDGDCVSFVVNGDSVALAVGPFDTLLSVLRDDLELTGSKYACGEGECGACTVLLDGRAVNACLVLAAECEGAEVLTIEGLATNGDLHPIQKAFVDHGAIQCGFCSPGMIMATHALLAENPSPGEDDVRRGLEGNLCRCTGYRKIIDAVLSLVEQNPQSSIDGRGDCHA